MKQFGEYILDSKQTRLLYQGQEIAIEPKLFELLSLFVEQPNSIISRQDILDNLWANSLVTDNAINKMIANLRKVLNDGAKDPSYIQTVPKRGYRLICNVTLLNTHETVECTQQLISEANQQSNSNKTLPNKLALGTTIVLSFLLLCFLLWQAFISKNKESADNYYSIALTRAHGAEQSAHMHPNNEHLYYLKNSPTSTAYQLWMKNIRTERTQLIDIGHANVSKIIALDFSNDSKTTNLFYLDKKQASCGVYRAILSQFSLVNQTVEKLFDCSDKRIKDIDFHPQKQIIYYAAQPKNLWPNQIYAFDLKTKKHHLVTQVEPTGWGHHSIDISPDGEKLLIMSTNNDYKTQLLSLNLRNNDITNGVKFNHPVYEAIWHHDSEHIYYYAAPPTQQIIKSDLHGNNATTIVNVSENLSPRMSLFPDGKNVLFSTEQKNYSNRWLETSEQVSNINNSTVDDISPALFHHSPQFLFVSTRSGRRQLYMGSYDSEQTEIVTNFPQSYWLDHIAVSADDQSILLTVENKVYQLPISALSKADPLTQLKQEQLIYTSENPIISLDWLTKNRAAITAVANGTPELITVNLSDKKVQPFKGRWAYGLSDSEQSQYIYLIEQQSNTLYRAVAPEFEEDTNIDKDQLINTQIKLPNGFFHVKIDSDILYYGNDENNNTYLNTVQLSNSNAGNKYLLNDLSNYDVSNGKIMVSDVASLEGDIHRTMQ